MSENQYKVLINKVKGVRTLVPYNNEFYTSTFDKLIAKPSEQYESIYIYNQEHFDQFKKTKSLAGISGVKTDKIVFDFDSKEDVEKALQDTRTVVSRLKADGFSDTEIGVSFSGSKGFHVVIGLIDETVTRDQFEAITSSYAGDLETFDTTVSDEQRVFRMPLSQHGTTGKFKIPVAVADILNPNTTAAEISEYASNPDFEGDKTAFITVCKARNTFKVKAPVKKEVVSNEVTEFLDKPDFTKNKTGLTDAKFALSLGYFEASERHEATMILASTWKALGLPLKVTYKMVKAAIEQRNDRLGLKGYDKTEIYDEVASVYDSRWKGGTYDDNSGLLKKTKARYKINEEQVSDPVVELNEVATFYQDFAENIDKNTIKLGIPEIDDKVRITTSSLVGLLAAPSAGKSSLTFAFMNYLSNIGESSLFQSMDMSIPQVYQRLIQKHTGLDSDTILKNYKQKNMKEILRYNELLKEHYKNVRFSFKSGVTTGMIKENVDRHAQRTGAAPKLVAVDYLGCIRGPYSDMTANQAMIASELKDIATDYKTCMFVLVQPQKHVGTPADEIASYRNIKGSSVLEEQMSTILSLSRPGFSPKTPEDDIFATVNVLKNRMGELSSTDLSWHGLTGTMKSLTDEEKAHLKALREALAQEKAAEAGLGGGHTFKRFGQGGDN